MQTILEKIIETKREEITARKQSMPIDALQETITTLGRPRNFFQAVTQDPQLSPKRRAVNLIAEVKKASLAPA